MSLQPDNKSSERAGSRGGHQPGHNGIATGHAADAPLDALLDDVQLDALGLLDDDDRAALDAWLETLPEPRREQIRQEQERLTLTAPMIGSDGSIATPESLRRAVVEAVLAAIESERDAASSEDDGHRRRAATTRRHTAGGARPQRHVRRRVHPMWRAATLGLAVALVGAVMFHAQTQRYVQNMENTASLSGMFDVFGSAQVEAMLFEGSMRRVTFVAADGAFEGMGASVWLGEADDEAMLFTCRLPDGPGVSYRIAELDDAGNAMDSSIARFEADGVITRVALKRTLVPTRGRIALVRMSDEGEKVVMTANLA